MREREKMGEAEALWIDLNRRGWVSKELTSGEAALFLESLRGLHALPPDDPSTAEGDRVLVGHSGWLAARAALSLYGDDNNWFQDSDGHWCLVMSRNLDVDEPMAAAQRGYDGIDRVHAPTPNPSTAENPADHFSDSAAQAIRDAGGVAHGGAEAMREALVKIAGGAVCFRDEFGSGDMQTASAANVARNALDALPTPHPLDDAERVLPTREEDRKSVV